MSWDSRLLPTIILTSPEGTEHTGKFRASNDPQTKNIATFKTVLGNYGRVQDLGADLRTSSFTVYFDGDDCDLDSEAFIASAAESGPWTIDHPVRGRLNYQYPSRLDPSHDPTESGNVVAVACTFITDYPADKQVSQINLATQVKASVDGMNESSAASFSERASSKTASLRQKITDAVDNLKTTINNNLGGLISAAEGVQDLVSAVEVGIDQTVGTIEKGSGILIQLALQIQTYPQMIPNLVKDAVGEIGYYIDAVADTWSETLSGTQDEKKNQAVTTQMVTLAVFGGLALSVIGNQNIKTRPQAIEAIRVITDSFINLTNALDTYAEEFDGLLVKESYFSQTDTFSDMIKLIGAIQRYLLNLATGLKAERTVILDRPLSATFASLEYYGSADDEYLDLLIEANNLSIEEIMRIPAGRSLVVYI
jgi:prophage DNA circulation protein